MFCTFCKKCGHNAQTCRFRQRRFSHKVVKGYVYNKTYPMAKNTKSSKKGKVWVESNPKQFEGFDLSPVSSDSSIEPNGDDKVIGPMTAKTTVKGIVKLNSKSEGANKEGSQKIHVALTKASPCKSKITGDISKVEINQEKLKLLCDPLNNCCQCKVRVCKKAEQEIVTLRNEIEFLKQENFHLKLLYFTSEKSTFFDDYNVNIKNNKKE